MQSLENLLVASLPEEDRELLRHAAVLQYVTPELARAATDSEAQAKRLLDHPLLEGNEAVRAMPLALRRELLKGWEEQASEVLERVVAEAPDEDPLSAQLYARLAAPAKRPDALRDLASQVDSALAQAEPDVARAHDLVTLLDEWPIDQDPQATLLRDTELAPRLRRYARAARDREITSNYLERAFENRARELLLDDTAQWMLQLHAPGGRGKTVFLRNFLGRYCPEHDIPVARIDFDYVAHIVTVTQEPWRLLLAVARQLDPQLPGSPFRFMLESYGEFQALLFAEALPRRRSSGELDESWSADSAAFSAAEEVPRKFRVELRSAIEDQPVVIILDTLENVLHTEGASVDSVLAAFDEVRSHPDEGVRGLRLVLSGRFDLQSIHTGADGSAQARAASFEETWVGPQVQTEVTGDTVLRIARNVISVELPPFSRDESLSYLKDVCGLRDQADAALIDTIVERCAGNPFKLALLAEQVRGEPPLTADDVAAFESVELFVLVDRVVDRLRDAELQWLLRWGVLPHVLTRDFAETVIWPALIDFVEGQCDYDDTEKDGIRPSRHEVTRWAKPDVQGLRKPSAAQATWNRLLEYAAEASWVSEADDLRDAVVLHPETRDPLRRLLRRGRQPAYDDIHARSLRYWMGRLDTADPNERAVAVRGVMFHAYQPWAGDRPAAASVWQELLRRFAHDRTARAEVAAEILQAVRRPEMERSERPTKEASATAHLELSERLVYEAAKADRPIDEARLSAHSQAAEPVETMGHKRRWLFLRAALQVAQGEEDAGWESFVEAMTYPDTDWPAHVALVAAWLSTRTPPANALETVERLAKDTRGTALQKVLYPVLARGLIEAERWSAALAAARTGGQRDLEAAALLGQGHARAVFGGGEFGTLRRAEAALLRYDPEATMRLLADEPPNGRRLFLEGCAHVLNGAVKAAMSSLSSAASGDDHVVAADAVLALARLLIGEGEPKRALSELSRLRGLPKFGTLRKYALEAVAIRAAKEETSLLPGVADELGHVAGDVNVPPSVAVEIELGRLEAGLAEDLEALGLALSRIEATGARLLAVRGMARLRRAALDVPKRLRKLAKAAHKSVLKSARISDEPALVLGAAELLRVTGFLEKARDLLAKAATKPNWSVVAHRAVKDARARCDAPDPRMDTAAPRQGKLLEEPPSEEPQRPVIRLSTGPAPWRGPVEIYARMDVPPSDSAEFTGARDFVSSAIADGPYALVKQPDVLFEDLGQAIMLDYLGELLHSHRHDEVLELLIEDEGTARLPWELATYNKVPLSEDVALVRRVRTSGKVSEKDRADVAAPKVLLGIAAERKDRGYAYEILADAYGEESAVPIRPSKVPAHPEREARIVHIVVEIAQRRKAAGFFFGENFVTAHNLADWLNDQLARLVVLDLAFESGDASAAEQLMLANSFAWTLCASVPGVSVLSGVFAAGSDHISRVPVLTDGLKAGKPLSRLTGELQRFRELLPRGGGNPLRNAVLLVTATPDRCFVLEK